MALVVLMILVGSGSAQAADTATRGGSLAAGPRLAGGQLLRLVGTARRGLTIEATDLASGKARTVASLGPGGGSIEWDASSEVVAIDRLDEHGIGGSSGAVFRTSEVFDAGLINGRLQRVVTCAPEGQVDERFAFDVDGTRVAYPSGQCDSAPGGQAVVVRDMASGATTTIPVKRGIAQIALAGNYLAVGGPRDRHSRQATSPLDRNSEYVAIYDWPSSRLIDVRQGERYGDVVAADFDIQDDGKVVRTNYSRSGSRCGYAEWFQAGSALMHRLPHCVPVSITGSGVQIAGDRIALPVSLKPDQREVDDEMQLVVTDLAGASSQPVFTSPVKHAEPHYFRGDLTPAFDFDGTRVAYPSGACDTTEDLAVIEDLSTPPFATASRDYCPVSLSRRSVRVSKSGVLSVEVRCPVGCRMSQWSYAGKSGGALTRAAHDEIARGGSATLRMKLPVRSFRALKRDRRRVVSIVAQASASFGYSGDRAVLRRVVLKWPG